MNGFRALSTAALLALAAASGIGTSAAAPPPSDGAYTAAQAELGAKLYGADCSSCHSANLHGGAGPALIGEAFTAQWTGERAFDPYRMMTANMPQNAPGSLNPAEYLAIMAYILQQNGFPSGSVALTPAKLQHLILVSPASSATPIPSK